jgi:hypothetical protein
MAKRQGTDVNKTLVAREKIYGDFAGNALLAQQLKDTMRAAPGYENLNPVQREALDVIQQKIARTINGNPNYPDSWHDIGGYAKLVEQDLEG